MAEKLLTVEVSNTFDVLTKETENEIFVRVYVNIFRSGLVAELGADRLATLLAIASYMNADGQCYPTQEQLANDLGVTPRTMRKYVKNLLEFRWNDRPIVERVKYVVPGTLRTYSVYTILPISQVAIFKRGIEPIALTGEEVHTGTGRNLHIQTGKGLQRKYSQLNNNHLNNSQVNTATDEGEALPVELKTASDVLKYFYEKYREVFGAFPSINWVRHGKLVKDKLLPIYTPEQMKKIVNVSCEQYEERWASPNFPRPTIGAIVSWLASQALAVAETSEKEQARLTEAMNAPKHGGRDIDDILSKL